MNNITQKYLGGEGEDLGIIDWQGVEFFVGLA